jgi:hypothetical protein
MSFRGTRLSLGFFQTIALASCVLQLTLPQSASPSGSGTHASQRLRSTGSSLDAGSVSAGKYRNSLFGFSVTIPAGWVLRTEEMNARSDEGAKEDSAQIGTGPGKAGRVLLAGFSRPPEARAEDVNASILIAAESASEYPGLKEAAQYFGPVVEAAKAQGFEIDDDPYEFAVGTKKLVRGDFQKDMGTRVMRQSTLVVLARGYAVSFTFIGGTEDEVEELVGGLSFGASAKSGK